ncbi:MAG TPA: nitric oxide synthase oxygenase [Pseudonocardiaceae bacterium]|nr:nitric oxide synthase oxygenase [Pseudonocardiaceae bacterium]
MPRHVPAARQLAECDLAEAAEFLELFHREHSSDGEHPHAEPVRSRLAQVRVEVAMTGTYRHTPAELAFGARVAWRNAARCIGRLYWHSLRVRDLRHVTDAAAVTAQCVTHLRLATGRGKIRPLISVFAPDAPGRPGPRIYNEQLIRYAGYRQAGGAVLGDPRYVEFTKSLIRCGWQPPARRSAFDVLPLVVTAAQDGPRITELPRDAVLEVPLHHPELDWFAELGLRWHAVPAISHMRLRIGGVDYPAAPFNGWYLGTEIGARNLADIDRYNLLPQVAERMGLDTSTNRSLWRDRALVEVNRAVLHSFDAHGVTLTDHHTESERFLTHLAREQHLGRRCPADWSWIVPPMSGSQTPVFHRYYDTTEQRPAYLLDPDANARATEGPHARCVHLPGPVCPPSPPEAAPPSPVIRQDR